jgi:hypothetical protein
MLAWLRPACCGILLLLAGCSATRMAYDHLDILMRWQASDYVDLTDRQRHAFNVELYRLWAWHRRNQLPQYAADLRHLADEVQAGPLSLEQLDAVSARVAAYWDGMVDQATPGYARLHADLSDTQVADMIRRIGKQVERKERKRHKQTPEQRLQHNIDEMDDTLRDWIGRPNAAQRLLVEQWARGGPPLTPELQQQREQLEQASLDRYAAVLATRTQPGFEERMRSFFMAPETASMDTGRSPDQSQQQRWLQLVSDLSATLEPAQREHLRRRLLDYAADFEALAAEKPPQAPEETDPNSSADTPS